MYQKIAVFIPNFEKNYKDLVSATTDQDMLKYFHDCGVLSSKSVNNVVCRLGYVKVFSRLWYSFIKKC